MSEKEVKNRIQERLNSLPGYRIICIWCGEFCCNTTEQREMLHYRCWKEWKMYIKSRRKPIQ